MGITWDRIRTMLARHIGERNIELIERAYEIISNLIEMGPQGVFEMIREQLDPRNILNQVLQAAVEFLIETLITRVAARIVMMLNPAGAVLQAVEAIYRVLRWIFDNAARIFSLIEAIVNGAAALIAGNLSGMANAVEGALARLIAPVIDFLAGFLGLGALPDRIADTIRGFQDWVMGIIERVVRWIAQRARRLLRSLGVGGRGGRDRDAGEEEVGTTERFGEHRMWHDVQGTRVRVMVASERPETVDQKLQAWARQDHPKRQQMTDEQKTNADTWIRQAQQQLATAQREGNEAAQEIQQSAAQPENATEASQAAQANREARESQEPLGATLLRIFNLFDEPPDINAIAQGFVNEPLSAFEAALRHRDNGFLREHYTATNKGVIRRMPGKTDIAPALH